MITKKAYPRTQRFVLALQLTGDALIGFGSLSLAFYMRFRTALHRIGTDPGAITYDMYLPLIALGTLFFVGSYAYLNLYDAKLLLRPHRAMAIIVRAIVFWMLAFLGISLALKFEPVVSRIFVAISCLTTLVGMIIWRASFFACLSRSSFRSRILQRVLLVGWTADAEKLAAAIAHDRNHPYEIEGYLEIGSSDGPVHPPPLEKCLGTLAHIERVIGERLIDIVLVADPSLSADYIIQVSNLCERRYVQFKIMPTFFRIFVSNLHLQTISGVPVLGVESLRVSTLANSAIKRLLDIVGALVGLVLSLPIILIFAVLIKRESPGPIFYEQVRTGRHGRLFRIYKLRSMRVGAEPSGAQWAVKDDPRRTRIGTFMRETNIDELPQFWNVLRGDMSLVGPRPERPELIAQFETEIPHYNPRHEARPGITGWAQVNGFRGNTSLIERIRCDLYYIENWSIWFDIQIMVLTFFRRKNAY